jgi:hypothetical protein
MVDVVVDKLWWKKSVGFVDCKSNNVGFLITVNVFLSCPILWTLFICIFTTNMNTNVYYNMLLF